MNEKKRSYPPKGGKNNKRRRNFKRRGNKPKGPYLTPQERIFKKYLNLLEQHVAARKKYYELYFRADPNQKRKLEKTFDNTIEQLRQFEETLNENDKKLLFDRINGQRPDLDYTNNHQLEPNTVKENVEIEDPHFLPSQASADFRNDTEESSGSMDDYLSYKGLK